MNVDRAWLDFLRDQFPKGSQVRSWELDDPEHISIGTLEQIDEEGRFHTRLEDGTIRKLTLGEEQFSVHPPEPALLKLYMPMTADLYERDEWGDMSYNSTELDSRDLVPYSDMILDALVKNRMPEERERGLMYWYEERDSVEAKVRSAEFTAEVRDGRLWCVAECQVVGQLTPEELKDLKDYLSGQAADGWGEGFEQRELEVDGGELYVHLWNSDDWSIQTEQERFSPKIADGLPEMCFSTLPSTGQLICIKRGESGCYPSEWDTGDKLKNVDLADDLNEKLGVTHAQRQAMEIGSMTAKECLLFAGALALEHPERIDRAMELANQLPRFDLYYGAGDNEALGRFVLEYLERPSPKAVPFLHVGQVGAAYQEQDRGIFCQGHYLRRSSPTVPRPEEPQLLQPVVGDYAIRVKLASRSNMDGVWVGFPDTGEHMDVAYPDELLLGLDALQAETLQECIVLEVDCCLPQLRDIPSQYDSAGELVRHAIDFGYA